MKRFLRKRLSDREIQSAASDMPNKTFAELNEKKR